MTTEWNEGDGVGRTSSAVSCPSPIDGTVVREPTAPTDFEGHHVAAAADGPQYLVKSERTGAATAPDPSTALSALPRRGS